MASTAFVERLPLPHWLRSRLRRDAWPGWLFLVVAVADRVLQRAGDAQTAGDLLNWAGDHAGAAIEPVRDWVWVIALVGGFIWLWWVGRDKPAGLSGTVALDVVPRGSDVPGIEVEPRSTGFVVYLRVLNRGQRRRFQLRVNEMRGLVGRHDAPIQPFYIAWIGPDDPVPNEKDARRALREREIFNGGFADIVIVALWSTPQTGPRRNLFVVGPADGILPTEYLHAEDDDLPRIDVKLSLLIEDSRPLEMRYKIRGGHGLGGLTVEDEHGNRITGQPRPTIRTEVREGRLARLSITNHGEPDDFRVKVEALEGTQEREDQYHCPWRLTKEAVVRLDTGETELADVAELNAANDPDALVIAHLGEADQIRFYSASGQGSFDRTVSRPTGARMKLAVRRARADAPAITGWYRIAVDEQDHLTFALDANQR